MTKQWRVYYRRKDDPEERVYDDEPTEAGDAETAAAKVRASFSLEQKRDIIGWGAEPWPT